MVTILIFHIKFITLEQIDASKLEKHLYYFNADSWWLGD